MPEEIIPSPQPAAEQAPAAPLESDITHVASEVARHKENPELSGASERELVRQAIRSVSNLPVAPKAAAPTTDDSVLPAYMSSATPAQKLEVEDLLRTAFKDGIAQATSVAQKSSPFVLDAFHDTLTGTLHEELKKRKMI